MFEEVVLPPPEALPPWAAPPTVPLPPVPRELLVLLVPPAPPLPPVPVVVEYRARVSMYSSFALVGELPDAS
jgi:hypothetical protein